MPIFFAIGLFTLGYLAGRSRGRSSSDHAPRMLSSGEPAHDPGGYVMTRAAGLPGPIQVLVGFMKQDRDPPPVVVQHAIAEAKSIGRHDLANDIVQTFGAPTKPAQPIIDMPTPSPRVRPVPASAVPSSPPGYPATDWQRNHEREHGRERHLEHEIEREREHEREMAQQATQPVASPATPPIYQTPQDNPWANFDPSVIQQMQDAGVNVPSYATPPQSQPAPGDATPSGDSGSYDDDDSPVSSGSPLPGVHDSAWDTYRTALAREAPTFESSRHIGRYRQHKDRLRELGCDPAMLINHPRAPELQDAALAMDAIDSTRHLAASGMTEYVGRAVAIPGEDGARTITLSGLLGLAQVAGLEGCAGWLENHEDRKKFRHTTAGFVATNGVF